MRKTCDIIKEYEPILRFIEVTAIVVGVIFACIQLKDLKIQKSADLTLKLNEYLDTDINAKIFSAIDNDEPLLKDNNHGGSFSNLEIEDYLSVFEILGNLYDKKLIDRDMLQVNFSYDIVRAYKCKELEDFVKAEQKDDPTLWTGFINLGKEFSK